MTNTLADNAIRILIDRASEKKPKTLMSHPACQDHVSSATSKKTYNIKRKMNKLGERIDCLAQSLREHVKLSPKLTDTVKGKLKLGVKILQEGGLEKTFMKLFAIKDSEKLMKVSQCYLSTTSGPIAGLLFISTHKVAFCSERSIKILSPTGKLLRIDYKVTVPISKIYKAKESANVERPSQKYIQIVTEDDFEFWFMGFLNHQTTLKYLHQAISGSQAC